MFFWWGLLLLRSSSIRVVFCWVHYPLCFRPASNWRSQNSHQSPETGVNICHYSPIFHRGKVSLFWGFWEEFPHFQHAFCHKFTIKILHLERETFPRRETSRCVQLCLYMYCVIIVLWKQLMKLVQACLRAPPVVADEAKLAIVITYFFFFLSSTPFAFHPLLALIFWHN